MDWRNATVFSTPLAAVTLPTKMVTSAQNMRVPCTRSVVHTERYPPMKVYRNTMMAPMTIMAA